jgi:stage III sporulation protein AF
MIAILSEVVRNIVVLIILVTVLEMLMPRNDFRPYVNMVVGLVLMLMLLSPLRSMLQFPGALDPVLEMRLAIAESDIEKRQIKLEQMNWELTLDRYRGLVRERVGAVLAEEGLTVTDCVLELEEDVNHMEFGQPRHIVVTAQLMATGESSIGQVEKVRIDISQKPPGEEEPTRDSELERKVATVLGMSAENIEVYVLNGQ